MQFKGTFGIRRFRDLEDHAVRITSEIRRAYQVSFWTAIGSALLNHGRRIPVLTGDTRKGIKEILSVIDMKIAKAGGNQRFASDLSLEMTHAKSDSNDEPATIGNVNYKRNYEWPPNDFGAIYIVRSRQDWANAIKQTKHDPDGATGINLMYNATGNAYSGKATFFFQHGPNYWMEYDQEGVDGYGPWQTSQLFDKEVREYIDWYLQATTDKVTQSIGLGSSEVGFMSVVGVTADIDLINQGSGSKILKQFDLTYGDFNQKVPF